MTFFIGRHRGVSLLSWRNYDHTPLLRGPWRDLLPILAAAYITINKSYASCTIRRRNGMKLSAHLPALILCFASLAMYPGQAAPNPDTAKTLMTMEQFVKDSHEGVEYVGNDDLLKRINANPKIVLIDVRSKEEYDAGHLKGATWVERGVAECTLVRTLRDPDAEIIVYCKMGNRSGLLVKALKRMGYKNVKSHIGFDAWASAGLSFHNYLGELKLIKLRESGMAPAIDYYSNKK